MVNQNKEKIQEIDEQIAKARQLKVSDPKAGLALYQKVYQAAKEISYINGMVKCLLHMGSCCHLLSDYDKALKYFNEVKNLSREEHDSIGELRADIRVGGIYVEQGLYGKALELFSLCMESCKQYGEEQDEIDCLNSLSRIYYELADYEKALEYALQHLKTAQEMDNQNAEGNALESIGAIYSILGKHQKAIDYHLQAEKIFENKPVSGSYAYNLHNIAYDYSLSKNFDDAERYFLRSLELFRKIGNKDGEIAVLNNMGEAFYLEKNDYDNALSCFTQSLELSREINTPFIEVANLNCLGKLFNIKKEYDTAIDYLHQSLEIAEKLKAKRFLYWIHKLLSQAYKGKGETGKALEHYEKFHEIHDEIFNEESDKRLKSMQIKFEVEKKELKIQQLEAQMAHQKKELDMLARSLIEKNELIHHFEEKMRKLDKKPDSIITSLKEKQNYREDWVKFKEKFNQVYPEFIPALIKQYPKLSRQELRVCALIKIGLKTKEIAKALYLSPKSISNHRNHARKKIGLTPDQSFSQFLSKI